MSFCSSQPGGCAHGGGARPRGSWAARARLPPWHAAALTLAAGWRGIPCHVVMPENAPKVKVKAVSGYGAKITFCKPTLEAREATLKGVIEATGAVYIP